MKELNKWLTAFGILFVFSCTPKEDVELIVPPDPMVGATDSISFLALGDSYTIGQGVSTSLNWPNQLVDSLSDRDILIARPDLIAQTGWTTSNLLAAIDQQDPGSYDLVSLLIGVNNFFQQRPFSLFEAEFETLVNRAIQSAGTKDNVVVVSIPDYGVTPFGASNSIEIAEVTDQYNSYIESRCLDLEIAFANITEISRALGDGPDALASDQLHPSETQYARWVKEMLSVVLEILED